MKSLIYVLRVKSIYLMNSKKLVKSINNQWIVEFGNSFKVSINLTQDYNSTTKIKEDLPNLILAPPTLTQDRR